MEKVKLDFLSRLGAYSLTSMLAKKAVRADERIGWRATVKSLLSAV